MSNERFAGGAAGRTNSPGPLFRSFLSVSLLLACAGCSRASADRPPKDHGGHLVDLPGHEQMQLELASDAERRELVVYVLETATHAPNAISSKKLDVTFRVGGKDYPVSLDADPQPADPAGRTSRFAVSFDKLPRPLHHAADFTATFTMEVQGETISGTLHHKDDHTHEHHHD